MNVMPLTKLSQRDSRWANIRLGWGDRNTTTIGSHGCTITDIAMLAGLTPDEVNRRLIAVKGYAASSTQVFNLVIWSKIKEAIPWLEFEWREYNYNDNADNERVKAAIQKNGGCLVEVDFDGTPRTDDRHWVLYVGNGKMYDPWTGTERPVGTYSIAKGYAIINVIGSPPEGGGMPPSNGGGLPDNYPQIIHKATQWDETVNQYGIDKKPEDATVTDLVSRTSTEEKKNYDRGYRAGEKKVTEVYADERQRLGIYDDIIFPAGTVPQDMDEIDVFGALDKMYLERREREKEENADSAAGESIKEPLRYVVGLIIGAVVTYAYSQYPILGEMGFEQQAITTSLIALVVRGLDKYVHTKDSSRGIDQTIQSFAGVMQKQLVGTED